MLLQWIDKELSEIGNSDLFHQYFEDKSPLLLDGCYYITNNEKGIDIVLSFDKKVITIHYFGENTDMESRFEGNLPLQLIFDYSRQMIRNIFGKPYREGGSHGDLLLGFVYPWDKYRFDHYTLHFTYSKDETRVRLLTAGSLSIESELDSDLN